MRSAWVLCLLLLALPGCEDCDTRWPGLDVYEPFPEELALEAKLLPPLVESDESANGALIGRWDFMSSRKLIYDYIEHKVEVNKYDVKERKVISTIRADLFVWSRGDGTADATLIDPELTHEEFVDGQLVSSMTPTRMKSGGLFSIGEDGQSTKAQHPRTVKLGMVFALPRGDVSIGERQKLPYKMSDSSSASSSEISAGEYELRLEGFLEENGHRCALFDIDMELEQKELVDPDGSGYRAAMEARGWSLFDTVDQVMDSAQLAVYSGYRKWATLTPEWKEYLCSHLANCEQIPDRFQIQSNRTVIYEISRTRQVTPSAKCFRFSAGDDFQVCIDSDSTTLRKKAKEICDAAKGSDCGNISDYSSACRSDTYRCLDENGKAYNVLEGY